MAQEDLAKPDYKTNREEKNLGEFFLKRKKIKLKSAQFLEKSWQFQKKKKKIF